MSEFNVSQLRTCAQRHAPGGQLPPSNLESPPGLPGPPRMAMRKGTFWPNGSHVKVALMGDTNKSKAAKNQFVKKKVMEKAKIWESYCNITFDFIDDVAAADIRVAFGPDEGSWSWLGTQAKDPNIVPPDEPTMNFGWFNGLGVNDDDEFERVGVHEFGHALGCTHELQSPAAGVIPWDREKVYKYFWETNGWDRRMVDAQVLTPDNPNDDIDTMFDKTSIMCYPIPPGLTTDGSTIGWNKHLSPMDEDFIGKVYPKQTHDAGSFSTDSLPKRHPPNNLNSLEVTFAKPYDTSPNFAYGIHSLNMSGHSNIRVAASIDQITTKSCQVHVDTWNDTRLFSAGASWMETTDSSTFQTGVFDTRVKSKPNRPPQTVTEHVTFPKGFPENSPPTVLVFLKGTDMSKTHNWRLASSVSNVSASGFDLSVKSWGDTQTYGSAVTWLAFPSDKAAICGGTIDTGNTSKTGPVLHRSGEVSFNGNFPAGSPPRRLMMALNGFDFGHGKDLCIKSTVENVTDAGFTWHADSEGDSLFYQAGLSWVAFA